MLTNLSNKPTIYFHDTVELTTKKMVGHYLYGARALGLTKADDLILLHPLLQSELQYILSHYENIGLHHTHHIIWDISPHILSKYAEYELSVFFFGKTIEQVRMNKAWFDIVNYANCKNNFIKFADTLSLPVPTTFCFQNKSALSHIDSFPCYLKASVSVSGTEIYRCQNKDELKTALMQFDDNVPFQIQEEIKSNIFLNLQYEVNHQGLQRLAVTEQLLNGYSHCGNLFPVPYEPWHCVQPIAEWMYDKGMQGIFGFDVAVVKEDERIKYLLIECNPRFNGASYPTKIGLKLKIPSWIYEEMETIHRSLKDIDMNGIEFNPDTKTGVVIVNWGTVLAGKIGVLIAGTIEQQNALRKKLKKSLTS